MNRRQSKASQETARQERNRQYLLLLTNEAAVLKLRPEITLTYLPEEAFCVFHSVLRRVGLTRGTVFYFNFDIQGD